MAFRNEQIPVYSRSICAEQLFSWEGCALSSDCLSFPLCCSLGARLELAASSQWPLTGLFPSASLGPASMSQVTFQVPVLLGDRISSFFHHPESQGRKRQIQIAAVTLGSLHVWSLSFSLAAHCEPITGASMLHSRGMCSEQTHSPTVMQWVVWWGWALAGLAQAANVPPSWKEPVLMPHKEAQRPACSASWGRFQGREDHSTKRRVGEPLQEVRGREMC